MYALKPIDLKEENDRLQSELGLDKSVKGKIQDYIQLLHEYNEIKDLGQFLFGKLAEIEGVTIKSIYKQFEVDLNE